MGGAIKYLSLRTEKEAECTLRGRARTNHSAAFLPPSPPQMEAGMKWFVWQSYKSRVDIKAELSEQEGGRDAAGC